MPEKYSIEETSNAPHSRFLGIWDGDWGGELCAILIVERIEASGKAEIVYSWANKRDWNLYSGWHRYAARVTGDRLIMEKVRGGGVASFQIKGEILEGHYENSSGKNFFTDMKKRP